VGSLASSRIASEAMAIAYGRVTRIGVMHQPSATAAESTYRSLFLEGCWLDFDMFCVDEA
jgi:hypothetical protein